MNLKINLLLVLIFVIVGCGDSSTNFNHVPNPSIVTTNVDKLAILISVDSASPDSVDLDWLPI